jgi:membrane protease YdiL (CAAX protease family)
MPDHLPVDPAPPHRKAPPLASGPASARAAGVVAPPWHTVVVAPPWHTVVLILVLLAVSLGNAHLLPHLPHRTAASSHRSRLITYSVTLVWEWLLVAFTAWGLRLRRTPWRQLLGVRRAGAMEWWTDIAVASGFWFGSALTLAACGALLRVVHVDPGTMRAAVLRVAPASTSELMLWIALSITAGICEELIFRGYLQQQLITLTRRVWIGAALSAILFGLAHGYQGLSGVLLITLYGAFFSILALRRRSLRAGMFAHAWQDASSGVILFLLAHVLHRLPH